jgi:hypothetical protein
MDTTIENKIKQVLYRMVEKRAHDYTKKVFQNALNQVIDTQHSLGRIDEGGVERLKTFAKMLVEEHCGEDENEEWTDADILPAAPLPQDEPEQRTHELN